MDSICLIRIIVLRLVVILLVHVIDTQWDVNCNNLQANCIFFSNWLWLPPFVFSLTHRLWSSYLIKWILSLSLKWHHITYKFSSQWYILFF